jgi:uncharacterized protein
MRFKNLQNNRSLYIGLLLCLCVVVAFFYWGLQQRQDENFQSRPIFAKSNLTVEAQTGARHDFTIEIAETPVQMAYGLMFVKDMPADSGMLFTFGQPQMISMWMKNTYIPLDMLFMDSAGRVISIIENTVPHSLAPLSSVYPAAAVLEIRGGEVSRREMRVGDQLIHPYFRP